MLGSPGRQCPACAQPVHGLAQLGGGHRGRVIGRAEADRVQHRGPAAAPGPQRGHHRVRPAGDHLRGALRPAVDVAEQPRRAGLGVRTQPRRDIGGQHDPLPDPRQRHTGHTAAQAGDLDRPVVEPVVEGAVPAAMLRSQRQIHQRAYRPVGAQQRLGQLELRVRPRTQARVELVSEPTQPGDRLDSGMVVVHAVHRGLRSIMVSLGENTIFWRPPHVAATRRHAARTS